MGRRGQCLAMPPRPRVVISSSIHTSFFILFSPHTSSVGVSHHCLHSEYGKQHGSPQRYRHSASTDFRHWCCRLRCRTAHQRSGECVTG